MQNARNQLHKCRFTCAVRAHKGNFFAAVNIKINAVINAMLAKRLRHAAQRYHLVARTLGLFEGEVHRFMQFRHYNQLFFQAQQLFFALLSLARFGCFIAKLLNERFKPRNFFKLLFALFKQHNAALLALAHIRRIVAFVQRCSLVFQLKHPIDHRVHKRAVVTYQNHAACIRAQKLFKPLHACKVKMVGWLVQKQHVGVSYQQLCKRNAHLPAARKLLR